MKGSLQEAVLCVSRGEFGAALTLLPVAVTPEEDWVRVVCLHVLNRATEIPDGGVLSTAAVPPPALREALLSAHARLPEPYTVSLVADFLPQGEQRAFLEAALPEKLKQKFWRVDDQGARLPRKRRLDVWDVSGQGEVVGALMGVLIREGDVQGVEALMKLFARDDGFSGPWARGLAWVYAALEKTDAGSASVLGIDALDEACRHVLKKMPSTGVDDAVLLAVLIGRAEELARGGEATSLWRILRKTLRQDLELSKDERTGPFISAPHDHEIDLVFIADNQEIDVIARLPGVLAFSFLRRAAGEAGRPERDRFTAALAVQVMTVDITPEWKAGQLARLAELAEK